MTEQTRAKWVKRILEWRESGLSVEDFTAGKDYAAASLRWAVSQVVAEKAAELTPAPPKTPRRRRAAERSAAPAPLAPRFVPVRVRGVEPFGAAMVVEVGGARICVTRGVDLALLGDVVRTLQEGAR
ncbi:MAG TPA: hypothetical protein VHV52_09220 [Gaiellaceae bacterium]|jgi:hypothetical protein|nr:hypothetical protein [Gaiellaceae bacterium]